MGCSASVSPLNPSIEQVQRPRVSRAVSVINFPPTENLVKHESRDVSTQTEPMAAENPKETVKVKVTTDEVKPSITVSPAEDHSLPTSNPRLSANQKAYSIKWVLSDFKAQQFSIDNSREFLAIPTTAITDAVTAMKRCDDLKSLPPGIWTLFDTAVQTDDAIYFIRAYTMETDFYKILNKTLANYEKQGSADMNDAQQLMAALGGALMGLNDAVSRLQAFQAEQPMPVSTSAETNWARLYLKPLFRLLGVPNAQLRYMGRTYRGVWMSYKDAVWYKHNTDFICNKAITSTSKLRSVAQSFIDAVCSTSPDSIAVMFTYVIETDGSLYALDVSKYSLLPAEEEVLLLPGVLWTVSNIQFNGRSSVEIEISSGFRKMLGMVDPSGSMRCPIQ